MGENESESESESESEEVKRKEKRKEGRRHSRDFCSVCDVLFLGFGFFFGREHLQSFDFGFDFDFDCDFDRVSSPCPCHPHHPRLFLSLPDRSSRLSLHERGSGCDFGFCLGFCSCCGYDCGFDLCGESHWGFPFHRLWRRKKRRKKRNRLPFWSRLCLSHWIVSLVWRGFPRPLSSRGRPPCPFPSPTAALSLLRRSTRRKKKEKEKPPHPSTTPSSHPDLLILSATSSPHLDLLILPLPPHHILISSSFHNLLITS